MLSEDLLRIIIIRWSEGIISPGLIILVGTQNASHRKKLKTDFTTSPADGGAQDLGATKAQVMAEILSLKSRPHLSSLDVITPHTSPEM